MTREEVLAVVAKHLASSVDGLDPKAIDPQRSVSDDSAEQTWSVLSSVAAGR